jgi:hypothetical protein
MTHQDIVCIRLVPLGASSYGKSSLLPAAQIKTGCQAEQFACKRAGGNEGREKIIDAVGAFKKHPQQPMLKNSRILSY